MVNSEYLEEYLEKFKRGKTAWDRWRKEHPNIQPDLSNIINTSIEVSELPWETYDLRRVILADVRLDGYIFLQARLQEVNLRRASLRSTYFWKARLRGASLSQANYNEPIK